ncbi:aldehyde dehydrogenase family protein [Streptomyces sp. NRRL S-1448]|nr:aldehyde dehydrogenase family protein [Streptomyces sp. NRRL S-1448]
MERFVPAHFHRPTVVTGTRQGDEIVRSEAFGPVVTVQPFTAQVKHVMW